MDVERVAVLRSPGKSLHDRALARESYEEHWCSKEDNSNFTLIDEAIFYAPIDI